MQHEASHGQSKEPWTPLPQVEMGLTRQHLIETARHPHPAFILPT